MVFIPKSPTAVTLSATPLGTTPAVVTTNPRISPEPTSSYATVTPSTSIQTPSSVSRGRSVLTPYETEVPNSPVIQEIEGEHRILDLLQRDESYLRFSAERLGLGIPEELDISKGILGVIPQLESLQSQLRGIGVNSLTVEDVADVNRSHAIQIMNSELNGTGLKSWSRTFMVSALEMVVRHETLLEMVGMGVGLGAGIPTIAGGGLALAGGGLGLGGGGLALLAGSLIITGGIGVAGIGMERGGVKMLVGIAERLVKRIEPEQIKNTQGLLDKISSSPNEHTETIGYLLENKKSPYTKKIIALEDFLESIGTLSHSKLLAEYLSVPSNMLNFFDGPYRSFLKAQRDSYNAEISAITRAIERITADQNALSKDDDKDKNLIQFYTDLIKEKNLSIKVIEEDIVSITAELTELDGRISEIKLKQAEDDAASVQLAKVGIAMEHAKGHDEATLRLNEQRQKLNDERESIKLAVGAIVRDALTKTLATKEVDAIDAITKV